jgi:hypothetical protein
MVPIPSGMRVIVIRVEEESAGAWRTSHSVLPVIGIQQTSVSHYVRPEPAPVHQSPSLMESHGWEFRHVETRFAPVFLNAEGRISATDPDDPCWCIVPPETSDEQVRTIAESLKANEVQRLERETRIENTDELECEVEDD